MEPKFEYPSERMEFIGRQGLLELQYLYPTIFKYEIRFEPERYSVYDGSFFIYDYEQHKMKKRVFLELKVRGRVWPDYILERNKVRDLQNKMKELGLQEGEFTLLYINFTPVGAYMWDITDIKPQDCKEKMLMNKKTYVSKQDKGMKYFINMLPETATTFNYILDENRIMKKYMDQYVKPKLEEKAQQKGLNWLFD